MATYYIKEGATYPPLHADLIDKNGVIPLDGTTIEFFLRRADVDGDLVTGTCTIIDVEKGVVEYEWGATDTAVPGVYRAEFKVTYPDDSVQIIPNKDYEDVVILAALASA